MNLIEQLNWRYATKKMNGQKMSAEKIEKILEAIRLSASSIGLQPYTILVIENEELRKKILPVANNQSQIIDCSHLLVFCAWDVLTEERINTFIDHVSKTRNVPAESMEGYKNMLIGISKKGPEENFNWMARQAYIALGIGIAAAALEEVDNTPMEGFNAPALDELLNLKEKGLRSVALLALGYRSPEDAYGKLAKVRRNKKDLFIELK